MAGTRLSPFVFALCSLAASYAPRPAAAQEMLGLEWSLEGRLFSIDPVDATTEMLGVTGISFPAGMDMAPDGNLYVVTAGFDKLWRIDPKTAAATFIADLDQNIFEGSLAISPDGTAFLAYDSLFGSASKMFTLDLTNGITTQIGTLSGGLHDINGMTFRNDGRLIAMDRVSNALLVIDANTATILDTLPLAPIVGAVGGMTVRNGVGYLNTSGPRGGTPGSNELYRINLWTAGLQLVGSFAGSVTGTGLAALSHGPTLSPTVYCTAKVNSLGCTPAIASVGASSAGATSGFTVSAAQVRNRKPGILCYSLQGAEARLFQGSFLCMRPPIRRGPPVSSGGSNIGNDCTGIYSIDMNAYAAGLLGNSPAPELSVPGTMVQVQWWGRDKQDAFATTLSDALGYTVAP